MMSCRNPNTILFTILAVATSLALAGAESRPAMTQDAQAATQKENSGAAKQTSEHDSMPGMDMGPGSRAPKAEMKPEITTGGNEIPPGSIDTVRFTGEEWSEFNHRGAGWFLFLWGLTALIAGLQWPRKTWWRYA